MSRLGRFGYRRVMNDASHESRTLGREQVRTLDRRAIEEFGVPSSLLMENAGRACAVIAEQMLADTPSTSALVLCGPGNNGGDGFVIARTLRNRGFDVELFYWGSVSQLKQASQDVRLFVKLWRGVGGTIGELQSEDSFEAAQAKFRTSGILVDALFGTGLTRDLDADLIGLIDGVAESGRPVLSVDLPSGLDADTGEIHGAAIRATKTVTFVASKPGFALGFGPVHCGEVFVAEIGLPGFLVEAAFRAKGHS